MEPHFVLFPYMLPGHMIPLIDIAKLIAKHGVLVTILTTPLNANRFETTISRAVENQSLKIQVIQLRFPCEEVGLPLGCENGDMVSMEVGVTKVYKAACMLEPSVKKVLEELKPPPSCLISDMLLPSWTAQLGLSLHIPTLIFNSSCCFSSVCAEKLKTMFSENSTRGATFNDDTEYFVVPDVPHRIELNQAQLTGTGTSKILEQWREIGNEMVDAEKGAFGIVVNTFEELEPEYIKQYKRFKGKDKVWCIGPVSLCNTDQQDLAERGNNPSINDKEILKWLDTLQPKSALYVCLGSLARLSTLQLIELGLGLELSNRPFIWVLRSELPEAFMKWLQDENFEERLLKKGGLVIRGWAPQVLILSHPSVGGFLTHCGWNSVLEGISAGLPLITWPLFAEQFCNEKLVVNVHDIGVKVGVEVPVVVGEEEKIRVQVTKENVVVVVEKLMDGGEEGEIRRNRAKKLGEIARKVVGDGGSSNLSITQLIQDVTHETDRLQNL